MTTPDQAIALALTILLVGMSIVTCLSLFYLFICLINRFVRGNIRQYEKDSSAEQPNQVAPTFSRHKKNGSQSVEDDLPMPEPFKVKTSFDGKRIGEVKRN